MSDIQIACALDTSGVVIGCYAVDPVTMELPGVLWDRLVPLPDQPQPTGEVFSILTDPEDPNSPTQEIPVLDWPSAGWSYSDEIGWIPPQ